MLDSEVIGEAACVFDRFFAVAANAFVNSDRNDFDLPVRRKDGVKEMKEHGAVFSAAQCDSDRAWLEVVLAEVSLGFSRDIFDQMLLAEVHP